MLDRMSRARQCYVLGAVLASVAVIVFTGFGLYFPVLGGVIVSTAVVSYLASRLLISASGLAHWSAWLVAGVAVPALSILLLVSVGDVVFRMMGRTPMFSEFIAFVGVILAVPAGIVATLIIRDYIDERIYGSTTLR